MTPCRTPPRACLTPPAAGQRRSMTHGWWGGAGVERPGHTDDTGTWRRRVVERMTRSDRGRRATGHDGATKHALGDVYGRDMRPWQQRRPPRGRSRPTRTAAPPPEAQRAHEHGHGTSRERQGTDKERARRTCGSTTARIAARRGSLEPARRGRGGPPAEGGASARGVAAQCKISAKTRV